MEAATYERFTAKYAPDENGCWIWTASKTRGGYGTFVNSGRRDCAHRVAYEHFVGAIPEGLTIDHLCRNTLCVNPEHLEAVTPRENVLRGDTIPARNAAKTHCKRGHEFTPENTLLRTRPSGGRECRTCVEAKRKRAWANKKESMQVV